MEICEEIEKIFPAAKKGDLLIWINWDGMEEAARLGPPQIPSDLADCSRTSLIGARSKNEPTPEVRYHVPLKVI